jgi:LytS/YehU family sensor histidine kinase
LLTAAVYKITSYTYQHKFSKTKKVAAHICAMPVLLLSYWFFCTLCGQLLRGNGLSQYWESISYILRSSPQLDIAIYAGVLVSSLGLRFYHQSMHERYEIKRLQNLLIQEQLKALRSQLNPHFLFNTLNTIASLVRLKREKQAISALSELSTMLRTILENKNQKEIRIRDEISFINSYLAIQKLRFSDKLDTYIHVQADCLEIEIPNMLLQPLVENAVQHGSQLESNQNPLSVEISRLDDNLKFVMVNKVAENDKHDGFGIGLSNTRERLARLYGQFRLELTPLKEGLFETVLTIPVGAKDA